MNWYRLIVTAVLSLLATSGCRSNTWLLSRKGYYPCSIPDTVFLGREDLGRHGYGLNFSERNGIVFTCRGGFIDISHLRKTADWAAYLQKKVYSNLMKNKTELSFKLKEGSVCFGRLHYPLVWKNLSRKHKETISRDISIRLGEYLAYTVCTWHEILTWFGYKSTGTYSEFASAFSWDDIYSNLLGCRIGVVALRDTEHKYEQAVTLAIDRELEKLDARSSRTAKRAAESLKGKWYSHDLLIFLDLKKRNIDIGLDDGMVTPWIIPSVSECRRAQAQSYPVPRSEFLSEYGFSIRFELEPREWEKDRILKIVYPDEKQRKKRLEPALHFPMIMDHIEKDAIARYGPDACIPEF
jgi:hypothetical protein